MVEPQPAKHGGVGGMNLPRSGGQHLGPVGAQPSVEHLLGFGKILDPGEAVVVTHVGHALFVHPVAQASSRPFMHTWIAKGNQVAQRTDMKPNGRSIQ